MELKTQGKNEISRAEISKSFYRKLIILVNKLFFDPLFFWYTASCILIGEALLNILIIKYVSYTEIDWKAYMQEVSGFLNGERDYIKLHGDTGPLVYPAGFVYIYSVLYYFTSGGVNIQRGQFIFAILYLWTQYVVFKIYQSSRKIPPYVLIFLSLSKRIHSIYVLRLFNDCFAMAFLYSCIWAMINRKWKLSWAWKTLFNLLLTIIIQIVLALPFLMEYPKSYFARAFEFSRVFIYKWTVNWKFLDEEIFISRNFASILLLGHVFVLMGFLFKRWCRSDNGVINLLYDGLSGNIKETSKSVTADHIITLMFTSNLIGIIVSRTLHYQFYSWYFHGLPFLLWHCTKLPIFLRCLTLIIIEYCWNVYPSTMESSLTLLFFHLIVLINLWIGDAEGERVKFNEKQE
ncbi:367_t:CDS:2 [Rhizophagus irregularis]|nr:367_t:CDS:2 [Rhizophagus irregularis]